MHNKIVQIQNEVKKVIIGKDDVINKVLMAILAQGHVLLEDVPGTGKTTLATAFAKALGQRVFPISKSVFLRDWAKRYLRLKCCLWARGMTPNKFSARCLPPE